MSDLASHMEEFEDPLPSAEDGSLIVDISVECDGWDSGIPGAVDACVETLHAALDFIGSDLPAIEVSVALVDDDAIRDLNRRFRGMDKPTNVLSFPALDPDELEGLRRGERPAWLPPGTEVTSGDLALALQTLLREAEAQGKAPIDHFRHLVVHGFLHLFGYDHVDDDEAEIMERLEARILARLGVPDPYDPERQAPEGHIDGMATDKQCND